MENGASFGARVILAHAPRPCESRVHRTRSQTTNAGVAPKLVQLLARHSTIRLTMDRYTHVGYKAMLDAVATLPDLLNNPVEFVAGQHKNDLQAGLQETGDTADFCVSVRDTNETPDKYQQRSGSPPDPL
jgi:hypothetical protein